VVDPPTAQRRRGFRSVDRPTTRAAGALSNCTLGMSSYHRHQPDSGSPELLIPYRRVAVAMSGATNSPDVTVGHEKDEKDRLTLSVPQVAGGAMASVTTAFAASFFGVAGTLLGAAFGSVLSSIATVVFGHSLIKAKRTLRKAPATAPDPAAPLPPDRPTSPDRPRSPDRSTARRRAWRPVVMLAGCAFLVAMAGIWVTEVAIGHPISGGTGKGTTSIGEVVHGRAEPSSSPSPGESASTAGKPSSSGTGAPTEVATSPADGPSQNDPGQSGAGTAGG